MTLGWLMDDQSTRCVRLHSPLYAALLARVADDVREAGPCWDVFSTTGLLTGAPLRFMGGVHRIVLEGRAPELARFYPSAGGDSSGQVSWEAFRSTVADNIDELREAIQMPIQTNEVGRCRVLLGGFLLVARKTGLPLRLLELGASAGLNLRWDQYHYTAPDGTWGNPAANVRFQDVSPGLPLSTPAEVSERKGCDLAPIDPSSPEGRLTLLSYVWADHRDRLATLDAAVQDAGSDSISVEKADARDWLAPKLEGEARTGVATVVFHSFVTSLMGRQATAKLRELIESTGALATGAAPLAWLRLEPEKGKRGLHLRTWPGGEEHYLATSNAWGANARWLTEDVSADGTA